MSPADPKLETTTRNARRDPEVIECEAVPIEAPGRARPQPEARTRRVAGISGWFLVFAILALVAVFKLAGLAIGALILMLRSPKALFGLLGGLAGWVFWRRWKAGRRTGGA